MKLRHFVLPLFLSQIMMPTLVNGEEDKIVAPEVVPKIDCGESDADKKKCTDITGNKADNVCVKIKVTAIPKDSTASENEIFKTKPTKEIQIKKDTYKIYQLSLEKDPNLVIDNIQYKCYPTWLA